MHCNRCIRCICREWAFHDMMNHGTYANVSKKGIRSKIRDPNNFVLISQPSMHFLAAWQLWKDDFGGRNSWISHLRIAIKYIYSRGCFFFRCMVSLRFIVAVSRQCMVESSNGNARASKNWRVFVLKPELIWTIKHWGGIQPIKHSEIHPFLDDQNSYEKSLISSYVINPAAVTVPLSWPSPHVTNRLSGPWSYEQILVG